MECAFIKLHFSFVFVINNMTWLHTGLQKGVRGRRWFHWVWRFIKMAPLILVKQHWSGSSLLFSKYVLYCFFLRVLNLSKTLEKWGEMSCAAVIPESLPNAQNPTGSENDILYLTSVQWPGDLGIGVCCCIIIMIICVGHGYGFYGLKIVGWRSAVECYACGLWITISEPISGSFLAFQRYLGPSVLYKDLHPSKSNPSTFRYMSTPHSQGSYHFTDFTGLFTSQNTLCQRGKNYKTHVSGAIKNVYYSTRILCWSLPKAQHTWQLDY